MGGKGAKMPAKISDAGFAERRFHFAKTLGFSTPNDSA